MTVLIVTGTDTGVGKTITAAALVVALNCRGRSVAVYKPVQAGSDNGEGDIDVVARLSGAASTQEGIRLRHPMAPLAASARSGTELPDLQVHHDAIERLSAEHDDVLVEGAGGLLVALDERGSTLADLAVATTAAAIVVCRSTLGTLNHTALTVEALARRGITPAGLVLGSWPRLPDAVDVSNRRTLAAQAVPLIGVLPEAAGSLPRARFRRLAPQWFRHRDLGTRIDCR